jgi:hypothetical protein
VLTAHGLAVYKGGILHARIFQVSFPNWHRDPRANTVAAITTDRADVG